MSDTTFVDGITVIVAAWLNDVNSAAYHFTGSGNSVRATSPTLVTPTLGAATATSINGLTLTSSTGVITLSNGKTVTLSNTLGFSGTDGSTLNIGTGGTLGTAAYTAASAYVAAGAITSSGLTQATARILGRTTASTGAVEEITVGSGLLLAGGTLSNAASGGTVTTVSVVTAAGVSGSVANPTTAPAITLTLGAITPTSVKGLTISTTTGTFTLTNGKTLTCTNTLTLTGTDGSTINVGTGGTLGTAAYTAASAYQPIDATLTAMAGVITAPDVGIYFTDIDVADTFSLTAAGRAILDDASAAAQRITLGLGSMATQGASAVAITGGTVNATIGGTTPHGATFTNMNTTDTTTMAAGSGSTTAYCALSMVPTVGTDRVFKQWINDGVTFIQGIESSVGGTLMSGSGAYDQIIRFQQTTNLRIGGNGGAVLVLTGSNTVGNRALQCIGKFACNNATPQAAATLPADATDLATAITLVNAIKAALIANGIGA